jgi:hypothetical protein
MTATLDHQIEQALELLDEQIARIRRIDALAYDDTPAFVATTMRDALTLYEKVNRLLGKRFTPSGNLINQDGVRERLRQVQDRVLTLREMSRGKENPCGS